MKDLKKSTGVESILARCSNHLWLHSSVGKDIAPALKGHGFKPC